MSSSAVTDPQIGALFDRQALHDLAARYGSSIDRRDWERFAACFTDVVTIDFTSFARGARADDVPVADFVSMVRPLVEAFTSTQHLIGNVEVMMLDADGARYTAAVQAQHWVARDTAYLIGGWYDNECRRTGGGWRISRCVLHQTWDAGDRTLLRRARRDD